MLAKIGQSIPFYIYDKPERLLLWPQDDEPGFYWSFGINAFGRQYGPMSIWKADWFGPCPTRQAAIDAAREYLNATIDQVKETLCTSSSSA